MANNCSHTVTFIGHWSSVDKVLQLFDEIDQKQMRSNRYHMPDFLAGHTGYMYDIAVGSDGVSYETHNVPNLDMLDKIADHYNVDYTAWYIEPKSGLYGEAVRTNFETQFVNIDMRTQKGRGKSPAFTDIKELQASVLSTKWQVRR